MITLLYLTSLGDVQIATPFEINQSCDSWFHHNVKVQEKKKNTFMTNRVYHEYKGKKVIGYICSDNVPQ